MWTSSASTGLLPFFIFIVALSKKQGFQTGERVSLKGLSHELDWVFDDMIGYI
jgi:hypothetical protein